MLYNTLRRNDASLNIRRAGAEKLFQNVSFSHFTELIEIEDSIKRAFYEMECMKGAWSVREQKKQILNHT